MLIQTKRKGARVSKIANFEFRLEKFIVGYSTLFPSLRTPSISHAKSGFENFSRGHFWSQLTFGKFWSQIIRFPRVAFREKNSKTAY